MPWCTRAVVVPGLLAWLLPALAAGQPAALPEDAPGERLEVQDGSIRKLRGAQVLWETALTPHLPTAGTEPELRGPLPLGDRLAVCLGAQLYELAAADGRVLRRHGLPGPCSALEAAPGGLRLVSQAQDGGQAWRWEALLARPDQPLPFFAFPAGGAGSAWARLQSRIVPDLGADQAERRAALEARPERRAELEAAVPRLQALAAQDPTNPWYHLTRGEYLALLGRPGEADQASRQALTSDPAHDHELLAMAEALGRLDPALGEEAHRRGLRSLLARGYEPELCHVLLGPMLLLGRTPKGERPREQLLARARRLLDVAPRVEGAAGFYAALAASGAGEEADRLLALAEEARPYQVFGPTDPAVPWTGVWLQALMACLLAVLVAGAVKSLRSLSTRFKPPVATLARLNPMARWSRGEQLGLVAVLALGLWCGGQAARGVALIGVQAAVPFSLLQGQLQHPAARAYLEALPARPGVVFLRAFGHQQAGETDRAMELYRGLEEPAAWTNQALLHLQQGDLARARELLARALDADPEQAEARLALGHLDRLEAKAGGPPTPALNGPWPQTGLARRLERLGRAGLEPGPLPALPSLEHWRDAWRARLEVEEHPELSDPLRATLAAVAATDLEGRAVSSFWETLLWLDLVLAALALLAFLGSFTRRELESTRRGKLGWALGAVLPGAARQYWLFGTAILAAFAYQAFGAWVLDLSQGASSNLLGAIALPGPSGAFGASRPLADPAMAWLDAACAHWWALLPVNLVFVVIAEKVAADPAGPFIRIRGMARAAWRR